jgi:DNA-binding response OmpR family regulator
MITNPNGVSSILIVEDEPLIALDIRDTVEAAGFKLVDDASKLDEALVVLENKTFHAVILDANLNGLSALPIAKELNRRHIPFVVLSGYSQSQQPTEMRAAPFIAKPFNPTLLVSCLCKLLSNPSDARTTD